MIGSQLGPYKIEAPIGAGGMGEVFRAHDTRLRRTVAIKVLPRERVADPERKRMAALPPAFRAGRFPTRT